MGYIMDLRAKVGKMPLVVVGASTIIVNDKQEVLLIRRNDNELWGLPAGSVELNESPVETAIREIYEETGLRVQENGLVLLNVFGGADFFYTYPNGDQCSNVVISYVTDCYSGTLVTATNETTDAQFFPLNQLPEKIAHHEQLVLADYRKRLKPKKE